MKLIVRADDLGLTDGVNHGIFKSIKDVMVTNTGLITNMPDAKDDYNLIKEFKYVSIGQHSNVFIGTPCSIPSKILSIVYENRVSASFNDTYISIELKSHKLKDGILDKCKGCSLKCIYDGINQVANDYMEKTTGLVNSFYFE